MKKSENQKKEPLSQNGESSLFSFKLKFPFFIVLFFFLKNSFNKNGQRNIIENYFKS